MPQNLLKAICGMYYKHQYFTVDTEKRKVFDENSKELQLTGNAYRVLVFLCENKKATITQIGSYLDWAKDYDENHLRQYRYKIETIIGKKVIEYKNGVYTLVGNIENTQQLANFERNTVLLHPVAVKLNLNHLNLSKKMKLIAVGILSVVVILSSIFLYRAFGYPVKKSSDGICHARGTTYYYRTKNFVSYTNIDDCLQSGGRLPKN